ncbi:MAG: efflux RND transporter periplasmic adaptor subunit [Acidobacteriota bacterium]|nr:efflux RND transporter periplasmic adaptor subunit [Acidobacteriota bacterium]MDQ2842157.1 efflux RND transporter periplasmic adaptor subunit [Acidobacteriota bacterium]
MKLVFLVICVMASVLGLASCAKKAQQPNPMAMMMAMEVPVRAVAAVATDVPLNVTAVGNVEAINSVDVKSRVAGQLLRVDFQEGQNVSKGQLLFEIDPEPLQRQINQINADLAKDAALEQQARANVIKDQANLKQTQASADRGLQLSKEGIFSKEQTEQVVATNSSTQASLDADRAAVESAVASLTGDRARLAQTQLQLEYTKITAPIAGRAGAIAVKAGNLVKDNDIALVTILQISPIYVSFGLPEQLLPEVQKFNARKSLVIQATNGDNETVSGQLKFIDNTVDTTTGAVKLKAEFQNANHTLWPGQFVNVQATLNLEHDRILIPSSTVENGPQGKYVWVMNTGTNTVGMRPVNVLRIYKPATSVEQAVIGSGLQPGEMVISEGQMRLMPGAKVKVLGNQQTQVGESGQRTEGGNS